MTTIRPAPCHTLPGYDALVQLIREFDALVHDTWSLWRQFIPRVGAWLVLGWLVYISCLLTSATLGNSFAAVSAESFETIRLRLVQAGASDGTVNDFGTQYSMFFRDPDGLEGEVLMLKSP